MRAFTTIFALLFIFFPLFLPVAFITGESIANLTTLKNPAILDSAIKKNKEKVKKREGRKNGSSEPKAIVLVGLCCLFLLLTPFMVDWWDNFRDKMLK